MIGFNLENCNPFGLKLKFEDCILNDSSFHQLQLPKIYFKDCSLENVDFSNTNLSQAIFENCNLKQAIFNQTNLEKANFTSAFNFIINPNENKIKEVKFSKENCIGLLQYFKIIIE